MRRWRIFIAGLLLASGTIGQAQVPARLTLKSGEEWLVALYSFSDGQVELQQRGSDQRMTVPADMFSRVVFAVQADQIKIQDLYVRGEFEEVFNQLSEAIEPLKPYLSIPNNMTPYLMVLLKAAVWADRDQTVLEIAEWLRDAQLSSGELVEVERFPVLALIRSGRLEAAEREIKALDIRFDKERDSALSWYLLARLRERQGRIPEAQEVAARIVAFHARDFEWMPPGLLLLAGLYGETGQYNAAEQVLQELRLLYASPHWMAQADRLAARLKKKELAELAAVEPEE
jgi:tetratricopeptide (TPR) repeat protein